MKNIYFDLCSIPLYLLILWICSVKKLTRGHANRIFISFNIVSLLCTLLDIWMEFVVNPLPLAQGAVVLGTMISFTYKLCRNCCMAAYLVYIFTITKTEYLLRPLKNRLVLWFPNFVVILLLLQNFFTHNIFVITSERGYERGPMLMALYIIALLYGMCGTGYCIFCKRYLPTGKWSALISVYILTFGAVIIEMLKPHLLVEMFSTSIGMLMILMLVMRPEETMDGAVGFQNWNAFCADMQNILLSKDHVQILAVQLPNAQETRTYLGELNYNDYLKKIAEEQRKLYQENRRRVNAEIYVERPGTVYLTVDDPRFDLEREIPAYLERTADCLSEYAKRGIRFEPMICLIHIPEDLTDMKELITLCHKFPQLGQQGQMLFRASEFVSSYDYAILSHMDEILNRAISENRIEMNYQPIYDVRAHRFQSAEALARLTDERYGKISPLQFIPAAETTGLILPIGEIIIEQVFRFIAENDLESLGLKYIEINLSVAQVLQKDLPQMIMRLQQKYGIDPKQVNFEITETVFDDLSEVMDWNVTELKRMGYSFSLDDYGIGYSNIQRMSRLPLDIVKIDKSLVDEMFTENGQVIIRNTVRMMKGIRKKLVIEGVETKEEIDTLSEMACDFIQGFYYSEPLPPKKFVQFLKKHQ